MHWHKSLIQQIVEGQSMDPGASWVATGFSIDTRQLRPGELFVPLKGPAHDGHDFIPEALQKGACGALTMEKPLGQGPLIYVEDTQNALWRLASYWRNQLKSHFLAITGSVGKTSVKEGLLHVLEESAEGTWGNYNNHIGLPLSLLRMSTEKAYGIFELGMNHFHEIESLSKLLQPHVACITQISKAHMGNFSSVQDIARAKSEIFMGIKKEENTDRKEKKVSEENFCAEFRETKKNLQIPFPITATQSPGVKTSPMGTGILPRDASFYSFLKEQGDAQGIQRWITFGVHADSDVRLLEVTAVDPQIPFPRNFRGGYSLAFNGVSSEAISLEQTKAPQVQETNPFLEITSSSAPYPLVKVDLSLYQERFFFLLPDIGSHWILNALAVIACLVGLNIDPRKYLSRFASFYPPKGRGQRLTLGDTTHKKGRWFTVIDDSYNASPDSMVAALKALSESHGQRKIAVLGQMNELGIFSPEEHLALLPLLQKMDRVFLCGPLFQEVFQKLPSLKQGRFSNTVDPMGHWLEEEIQNTGCPGDVILVKGSHSMAMDHVVDHLKKKYGGEK